MSCQHLFRSGGGCIPWIPPLCPRLLAWNGTWNSFRKRFILVCDFFLLQTISSSMDTTCKCHGMSASCDVITCWRSLPSFAKVGGKLKKKYRNAEQVPVMWCSALIAVDLTGTCLLLLFSKLHEDTPSVKCAFAFKNGATPKKENIMFSFQCTLHFSHFGCNTSRSQFKYRTAQKGWT